jgi:Tfp pilus assembly protein PilF
LPLSRHSPVVLNIKPINKVLLYVRPEDAEKANKIVRGALDHDRNKQSTFGFTAGTS